MADQTEFESTCLAYLPDVYRTAVALCRDREHAEDLLQATMLKALERFDTFRRGTNCKAWLLRILRNTWIDELRHKKVVGPQVQVDEGLTEAREPDQQTAWSNAADLLENFGDQQIIDALAELSEDQRLTLYLADVEGLSQEEVAEIMDVAVGTIKSRTSRARAELKDKLQAHARDLGFLDRLNEDDSE